MTAAIDPITFEVLRHRLWAVNDEQGMLAARLSGSPVVYEALDMNTGLLTAAGEQLFTGVYILTHAADLQIFVERVLREWMRDEIEEGDMFFTNDPAAGAIHANDGILATPIFWEGQIVAWSAIVMHDPDVGSPVPGSFVVGATDRFGEAPLFPPVKLVERFRLREDIAHALIRNHRTPEQSDLQMRARMAALQITHGRIHELIDEYGVDTFLAAQDEILAYVERVVRRRLNEIPDGTWFDQVYIDHDGNNDVLYPIRCRLTKQGGTLRADFTGTAEQAPGSINCARSGLEGALYAMFLIFLCHDLPWASGAARRVVEIVSEEGTINNATGAAATSMGSVMGCLATLQVVHGVFAKMLLTARSDAVRGEVHAPWVPCINSAILAGVDKEGGRYVYPMLEDFGGGAGARSRADGIDVSGHVAALASMVGNVEVTEERIPVLFLYRHEGVDSGGPGRFRGGVGLETAFTPHKSAAPITDIVLGAGRSHPAARGIAGGHPASIHTNAIFRDTNAAALFEAGRMPAAPTELDFAEKEQLAAKQTTALADGDVHVFLITGGGGFGDPLSREPERVAADVAQGLVTADAAREVYGVALLDGIVDAERTRALRDEVRRTRLRLGRPLAPGTGPPTAAATTLHPVGDTVEAVATAEGVRIRCTVCNHVFCAADEDFKLHASYRERSIVELTPINADGLVDEMVAREFSCPGCGTLVALDVQRLGEPLLPEVTFAAS
ncbi:MAG TPA: hydantoinase B/oxoprolinase family protein [Gaiellaceae bacterium]|nr:hydantoinase B/oxoprolinase family protein [Gaiellaceae bacterium]